MSLYGLIIGICLAFSASYFQKHNKIVPKSKENIFIIGTILFAIIGARAYHVIDLWDYYSQNLGQIIATWNGGLGIYGGLIGGVIFVTLFSWIYKLRLISIADSITPILPLAQAVGRIGNFFNHENPIWWHEAILDLILFFVLRTRALARYSITGLYLIGYGLIRFFTEFLRSDTWTIGDIKIAQIISILFILIGIYILIKYKNAKISTKSNNS